MTYGQLSYLPLLSKGDLITIKNRGEKLYKIEKVNPKNLKIVDEDGNVYSLNQLGAVPAPDRTWNPRSELPVISPGVVVEFIDPALVRKSGGPGKWVCIASTDPTRARFVRLNGMPSESRFTYWTVSLGGVRIVQAV